MSLAEVIVRARRVYLTYRRFHPTPEGDLTWDANFASSLALRRPERSSTTAMAELHLLYLPVVPQFIGYYGLSKICGFNVSASTGEAITARFVESEFPVNKPMVDRTMERNVKISMLL